MDKTVFTNKSDRYSDTSPFLAHLSLHLAHSLPAANCIIMRFLWDRASVSHTWHEKCSTELVIPLHTLTPLYACGPRVQIQPSSEVSRWVTDDATW